MRRWERRGQGEDETRPNERKMRGDWRWQELEHVQRWGGGERDKKRIKRNSLRQHSLNL